VTLPKHSDSRPFVRLLFWAAVLLSLVMALMPHPPQLPGHPSDKLQHAAAFATMGIFGSLAYPRLRTLRLILALSLFGAFIEVAQAIPALHRDSDPLDWLADTVACTAAVIAVGWWIRRRR
jgi:VanZ family protein